MAGQQAEGKKWTVPRGAAATAAKNKYRDNKYDRAELAVPKGFKARMKQIAQEQGYASYNSYVLEVIKSSCFFDMWKNHPFSHVNSSPVSLLYFSFMASST